MITRISVRTARTSSTGWIERLQQAFAGHRSLDGISEAEFAKPSDALWVGIAALCKQGQLKDAVDFLYTKDPECKSAMSETYVHLLERCSKAKSLKETKRVHAHIMKNGLQFFLANRILSVYTKCESLEDAIWVFETQCSQHVVAWNALLSAHAELGTIENAKRVFDTMPVRNVVSWNAMISAYGKHGLFKEAVQLFEEMLYRRQPKATTKTILSLLKGFTKPEALSDGKQIYGHIAKAGLQSTPEVAAGLIHMYGRCGSVFDARELFESLSYKDITCWAAIISACTQNEKQGEALLYFEQMMQEGLEPNNAIFMKALEACTSTGFLPYGKLIHILIANRGVESTITVANALILMYAEFGCLDDARKVFDVSNRDVSSWTVIIKAYVRHGNAKEALHMLQNMEKEDVKPNAYTYSTVIDALEDLADGKLIHYQVIVDELESNPFIMTALINLYARCQCLHEARDIFDKFNKKDMVLWTTMIGIYARSGNGKEAFELFENMEKKGVRPDKMAYVTVLCACASSADLARGELIHTSIKERGFESDIIVVTALINMHSKCGSLDVARRLFNESSQRDVILWTTIIAAYAQHDNHTEVLQLLELMHKEGVKPNKVTFVTLLDAFANCEALADGKMIHKEIVDNGLESDITVGTALVNLYIKCGSFRDVQETFSKLPDRDVDLWNMLIAVYVQHGKSKDALHLFEQMCQQTSVKPDKITFIHILSACSCAGLVDKGRQLFDSMRSDYGVIPVGEHYVNMVDLLGRAGFLDEAERYISGMACEPSAFVWMTMLNACKLYCDIERGERAAKRVLDLDEFNSEAYVLLESMYTAAGRLDDAAKVRDDAGKVKEKETGNV